MKKPLKILIKLNKSDLDRLRRELAEFLNLKEQKILEIKRLNDNLEMERDNLGNNPDAAVIFGSFIVGTRNAQTKIIEDIEKLLEPQIRKLTDDIAIKFTEMKKYDILLERRIYEEQLEFNRKLQIELDEIAITQFNIKNV